METTLPAADAETKPERRTFSPLRWGQASFFLQVGLLLLLAVLGFQVNARFEAQSEAIVHAQGQAGGTMAKLLELEQQNAAMRTELINLRQTVGSTASEDVLFLKVLVLKHAIDPALARQVAALAYKHASRVGKDPNLVLAIMAEESDFNPRAVSHVGAIGLMQVMPHWKNVLAIEGDLFDPDENVKAGLQILGFYLEMYGDLEMALTAYNRGPGPVDAALRKGASPNNGYAPKVLATYERLKRMQVNSAIDR